MSVRDMLDARDEFERQILSNYQNILDETFRTVYQIEGKVNWLRITRFSPVSNFILVCGIAELSEEYMTKTVEGVEVSLDVNFTIPMTALDNVSTAREIGIMAQRISALGAIVGMDEYYAILQNDKSNMDTINAIVDAYDDGKFEQPEENSPDTHLSGFDISDLTEDQLQSLSLSLSKKEHIQ